MSGINNEYKDRLFGAIFGRTEHRKWTLSLYNAINGSSYENPEEIVINTMDDSVYMGMKRVSGEVCDGDIDTAGVMRSCLEVVVATTDECKRSIKTILWI